MKRTGPQSRVRLTAAAAWLVTCVILGAVLSVSLAWSAAAVLPPAGIASRGEAEREVGVGAVRYRQRAFSYRMTGSPLAWAAAYYTSHCDKVGESPAPAAPSVPAGETGAVSSFSGSFASGPTPAVPPPSPGSKRTTDIASIAPFSGAGLLMPWLERGGGGGAPDPQIVGRERHMYAYGWPLPALAQVRDFTQTTPNNFNVSQSGSLAVPAFISRGRPPPPMWSSWTFPVHPLWTGLIVDTLVFGAAGMGLVWSVRAWRIARRRKRGLCVNCGYDLRGVAVEGVGSTGSVCPECGSSVRR